MIVKIPWAYVTKKEMPYRSYWHACRLRHPLIIQLNYTLLMLRCNLTPNKLEHPPIEDPLHALPQSHRCHYPLPYHKSASCFLIAVNISVFKFFIQPGNSVIKCNLLIFCTQFTAHCEFRIPLLPANILSPQVAVKNMFLSLHWSSSMQGLRVSYTVRCK